MHWIHFLITTLPNRKKPRGVFYNTLATYRFCISSWSLQQSSRRSSQKSQLMKFLARTILSKSFSACARGRIKLSTTHPSPPASTSVSHPRIGGQDSRSHLHPHHPPSPLLPPCHPHTLISPPCPAHPPSPLLPPHQPRASISRPCPVHPLSPLLPPHQPCALISPLCPAHPLKQPNKPVYRALGNPIRGRVTSQSDCRGWLSCAVYWQLRLGVLSKALAMDQESLSGGFMGKDQEN